MGYYLINTNERYAPGQYTVWLEKNLAFTHGDEDDLRYLDWLSPGDICFMWVNNQGIRAIGRVEEACDRKAYREQLIKRAKSTELNEYRIKVDWYLKLNPPYSYSQLKSRGFNTVARAAVVKVVKDRQRASELVREVCAGHIEDLRDRLEQLESADRFEEGKPYVISLTRHTRNASARDECIREYGYDCFVCKFNFEATYGEQGREIIQVHHRKPISASPGLYQVDPLEDLVPVCPNCHVMIHSRTGPEPYTVKEVRELFETHGGTRVK